MLMTGGAGQNDLWIAILSIVAAGGIPLGIGMALWFFGRKLRRAPRGAGHALPNNLPRSRVIHFLGNLCFRLGGAAAALAVLITLVAAASLMITYRANDGGPIVLAMLERYGWITGIPLLFGLELLGIGYYLRRRQASGPPR